MPFLRTILAAMLLAGGAGSVLAQTQASGDGPPAISAASPAAQDPGVNPSAAGTQPGDIRTGRIPESAKDSGEHGGATDLSANTHPMGALKANKQLRRRQKTEQALQRVIHPSRTVGTSRQQGSGSSAGR